MKFWKRIREWVRKWFGDYEKPEPKPQPSGGDVIDPAAIQWLGQNYSMAENCAVLHGGNIGATSMSISNPAPSDWPVKVVKVKVQGIICIFYERGGQVVGGKFDWLRPNQTHKGLENLAHGYNGHTMPHPSAKCYAMFVSVDGSRRSNIAALER